MFRYKSVTISKKSILEHLILYVVIHYFKVYFKFRVRKFMKLFKSLLVAPATLGLLAPMSATANEVTISDFTPAEQLAITNSRVDGLEARLSNIEAGSFSETTTASFSADFLIDQEIC